MELVARVGTMNLAHIHITWGLPPARHPAALRVAGVPQNKAGVWGGASPQTLCRCARFPVPKVERAKGKSTNSEPEGECKWAAVESWRWNGKPVESGAVDGGERRPGRIPGRLVVMVVVVVNSPYTERPAKRIGGH